MSGGSDSGGGLYVLPTPEPEPPIDLERERRVSIEVLRETVVFLRGQVARLDREGEPFYAGILRVWLRTLERAVPRLER